ncbi:MULTISPECIES: hypothetical protein [unclassified Rickettsia]
MSFPPTWDVVAWLPESSLRAAVGVCCIHLGMTQNSTQHDKNVI